MVFLRVLAFVLPIDFELKWAEDNQIGVGKELYIRRDLVLRAIVSRLSPDCRRIAAVSLDDDVGCYSIVVATNKTVEDLKRAKDLEMIQSVQRVLGTRVQRRPRRGIVPDELSVCVGVSSSCLSTILISLPFPQIPSSSRLSILLFVLYINALIHASDVDLQ